MSTILGYNKVNFEDPIAKLFANNEQGFFYDPNDLSTMYQDAAGTVPVTDVGQPVGLIQDKSGRNNHAHQTNSASRPILRQNTVTGANYLEFDGVDDFLQTSNIDFTATDKVSLFTGVDKLSDNPQFIAALVLDYTSLVGTFSLITGEDGLGNGYASTGIGSATLSDGQSARNYTYPAPDVAVLSVRHDISDDLSSMRRNGVVGIDGIEDKGTGNFGNYPLFIGRYLGLIAAFKGNIYSLIGVGKLVSEDETIAIEKELAKNTGVTLNV